MLRLLLLLLLALPLSGRAATISSTTCPGTGCVTTYLGNLTATAVSVQVSGTWVGTLTFESSDNNVNYTELRGWNTDAQGTYATTATVNGRYYVPSLGALYVRVRASAWTSGSATITVQPTAAPLPVDLVRVVGSTFGDVSVSGTVISEPSPNFLAALNPTRLYPSLPPAPTLTTTLVTLDDPAITNRTELTVRSLANGNLQVWCCRGASCTPSATEAYILVPGDAWRFEGIRDSDVIRCRAATDPVKINYIEVAE